MTTEEEYIKDRKKQAEELSDLFRSMQKYPIQDNKIVVTTYEGDGGYCCNPRYIVEELLSRDENLEIVWLTHCKNREFPKEIQVVEDTKENMAYHLSTAKIWIDNYRKPYGTVKRDGQVYIQTWHGNAGMKPIGLSRGDKMPLIARLVSQWDSDLIDRVLSDSTEFEKKIPRKLLYDGETLRVGYPRVDVILNRKEEKHRVIRERYGIEETTKLLLYAPTFHGGTQKGVKQVYFEEPNIDFDRLLQNLSEKYHCSWKILVRLHPQVAAKFDRMPLSGNVSNLIDVSQAADINEIIAGCDMVLSDYSSCVFDAAYGGVPAMLYQGDLKEYTKERGELVWTREEMPFLVAENNAELETNVKKFDDMRYLKAVKGFMEEHCVQQDGTASRKTADYIIGCIKA